MDLPPQKYQAQSLKMPTMLHQKIPTPLYLPTRTLKAERMETRVHPVTNPHSLHNSNNITNSGKKVRPRPRIRTETHRATLKRNGRSTEATISPVLEASISHPPLQSYSLSNRNQRLWEGSWVRNSKTSTILRIFKSLLVYSSTSSYPWAMHSHPILYR